MADERQQMSSEEMIRRAREGLDTAPPEAPETSSEDELSEEQPASTSAPARNRPPPPPPPAQRAPARKPPKFEPPPPRSTDYQRSEPAGVEKTRRTFKWARLLWVVVVVGVFFTFVGNRESEPEDQALFRDDFNGELSSGWTWVNGVPDDWAVTGGALRLAPGAWSESDPRPPVNLVLPSPGLPSYTFSTRIEFDPWANFHAAGLTVYQDGANSIQLVHAFCSRTFDGCVDDGVYLDSIDNGEFVDGQGGRSLTRASDHLFLRIDVIGNAYTGWYSYDGQAWTTAGTVRRDFASPSIGIVARSNTPQPPVSSYDFFEVLK